MAAILQMTFSNEFFLMNTYEFLLKLRLNFFLKVQFPIFSIDSDKRPGTD